MFTGIIQEIGQIVDVTNVGGGRKITVYAPGSAVELKTGDSVAVNGVCLTVVSLREGTFSIEAVEETLKKTTLGKLRSRSRVNLELALKLGDRLGGHLVQGHVDGIGKIRSIVKKEFSSLYTIDIPASFSRYVIPVGSISVDGVSLTVASMDGSHIIVSIIPHTLEKTTFSDLKEGSEVNLEFDLIGKYVESLLTNPAGPGSNTSLRERLGEWGYETEE